MKNYALICISAASLLGCVVHRNYLNPVPRMDVTIVNRSSNLLENALARFGEYNCGFGYVIVSGSKGWVGFSHPITARAQLQWDENGHHHVERVGLEKIYPPGAEGRLTFTVYDGRVEAAFQAVDFDRQ